MVVAEDAEAFAMLRAKYVVVLVKEAVDFFNMREISLARDAASSLSGAHEYVSNDSSCPQWRQHPLEAHSFSRCIAKQQ